MIISDIKNTIPYFITAIIVLVWVKALSALPWLPSIPLLNNTLLAVIITLLAAYVLIIIHFHSRRITHDSGLLSHVVQSSPRFLEKIDNLLENNCQEGILIIYLNGKILYSNGYARSIFSLSQSADCIFKNEAFPIKRCRLEKIKNSLLSGQILEEQSLIKINGQDKTFLHRYYPLSSEDEPFQIAVVSTDITELIEARHNADLANLSKNQFLTNMTHELRTPMIGILGSSDLLSNTDLNFDQHQHLNTIKECGEQLLNLINDILDLSKIDLGADTLKLNPVNLPQVIRKTVAVLDSNLKVKNLNLDLYIDPAFPPLVCVDELKLRQVITNLLINAIKFTPSGLIDVKAIMETNLQGDFLLFSVQDTGVGIPADKLNSIFNCFTQADSSSCREFGGIGMGLYICERLIGLMDGEIWVNSVENQGTTFAFRIPVNTYAGEEKAGNTIYPMDSDDNLHNFFLPIRILVVEDNELNQKLIVQMLFSYGFEVECVNNGLECLNILQQSNFDLILMDMQMPIMDGYEATGFIRANQLWQHIPIIAITANALSSDREKCLACGCNSYLAKPFKSAELVQEIKNQLNTEFVQRPSEASISNQLIEDLIPEFMELLKEMLDELQEAITRHDLKNIQYISHSIKGTAGMYGFLQISEIAALIEQASQNQQHHKISQLFNQIAASYQQINTRLNSEIVG